MTELRHHLTLAHIPSAPRLVKGSCSCGDWTMVQENRAAVADSFQTHLLIMRFAPDDS